MNRTMGVMSWSDDIRCLYCDGRLPLYRKITHGQFCSSAHRKEYWKEQERLAVERLHQTHNSLRAYTPPAPLAPTVEVMVNESLRSTLAQAPAQVPLHAAIHTTARTVVAPPPQLRETPPVVIVTPEALVHTQTDEHIPLLGVLGQGARPSIWDSLTGIAKVDVEPYSTAMAIARPALYTSEMGMDAPMLGTTPLYALAMRMTGTLQPASPCVIDIEPIPGACEPVCNIALAASTDWSAAEWLNLSDTAADTSADEHSSEPHASAPAVEIAEEPAVEAEIAPELKAPLSAPLLAIPRIAPPPPDFGADVRVFSLRPIPIAGHAVALGAMTVPVDNSREYDPAVAPMQRLTLNHTALVHGILPAGVNALEFRPEREPSGLTVGIPESTFALRLARGTEYPVRCKDWDTTPLVTEPVEYPIRTQYALPVHAATIAVDEPVDPPMIGLARLALSGSAYETEVAQPSRILSLPQPFHIKPLIPASKLEPLDVKPIADLLAPAPETTAPSTPESIPPVPAMMPPPPQTRAHIWTHAVDFWKNAPRDLKILLFTIPALIALAFQPALPKISMSTTPATTGFRQVVNTQMTNFRKSMMDRAAIALDEDFRSGLDYWRSRESQAAEWSYDATGFVKPAALAIYEPTAGLTDYQLQFLGMIDQKAMSWVVRAADFDNFYVLKLTVLKPGPLPEIGVTRYAVVNGRAVDRVDTPVRISARSDMLYRIRMDVKGDDFALYVQEQLADSWTEPRLRHGGVGFFNARGEESRVRWMQVTHQYDMLGRLCAYLAP